MNRSLSLVAALGVALVPRLAQAHFLWITLDSTAKSVVIGLQEAPGEGSALAPEKAALVKAWYRPAQNVALKSDGAFLKGSAPTDSVAASLNYGVLERGDSGPFWLNYYAKSSASPAASQANLGLPVELSVSKDAQDHYVVLVRRNGKPAAGADIIAEMPGRTLPYTGKTAKDGTLTIEVPAMPTVAIRALVTDNVKGTEGGKEYGSVRSYSTLSVGNFAAPAAEEPFTRTLQKAFGGNHDIVSHTAFVGTLMDGKLTKAQLEVHLQQRDLVHQAVDKILRAADPATKVPYTDKMKEIPVLLAKDLVDMGSSVPTEATARLLTKSFLKEIEDSKAKGPYFALGVLHIYYGGISNGGRQIGQIIGETVKFTPSYYEKSDGYRDYLKLVNEIQDPEARKEMIRGGQEAYKYIIASNDESVFKS